MEINPNSYHTLYVAYNDCVYCVRYLIFSNLWIFVCLDHNDGAAKIQT